MRVAIIFFISLCFLLLRWDSRAYVSTHHTKIGYALTHDIDKKQQAKFASSLQHNTSKEYFFGVEDEDEDFLMARKHVVLVRYFFAISYAFILSCFYRYLRRRNFCQRSYITSSCKYILHRVLII